MIYPGCLTLILVFFLLFLLPFFFAQFMLAALAKLGLSPPAALIFLIGIIFGSSVNIPIKRFPRDEETFADPFVMFGFGRLFSLPRRGHLRRHRLIRPGRLPARIETQRGKGATKEGEKLKDIHDRDTEYPESGVLFN
jgi:uncharacterized membrane protein